MTQFSLYLSRYLLLMATLCYMQFGMAQSILGFPNILDNSPPMAGTQATHDTLRWDDFVNYENHALYGPIGKAIGQLVVSYEGIDIPFPCTATLIAENILLTNYHCVYPSKKDAYGNTHRITSARIYMDYNQPDSGRSGLRSFAVSTIPIDYSEEPDFAILSTIDSIPFETYGLKNIKIGNYRDSNSLFLIHHSSEDLASDHKRLTNRDCVAMDFSRIGTTQIALPSGEGRAAIAGHDVPHFCDTKGGASGSLIFNNRGEIVGLNFAGLRNYDHRTKRFLPEDNRFNLFVDIQALLQASDTLSEILFGIEKQGSLSIDSTPSGATVVLEGQAIGTTPLRNVAYRIGDYQLRLSYSGYETYSESISIAAEQHVQRNITLEPELIRTADELVRRARQGGTLRLAAGTFRLSSTLELSGDVRLVGQGYEQTRIVSSAGEYVVRYTGGGTFAAQGVGFEYVGKANAYVMKVENAVVDIDACEFTGGNRLEDASSRSGGSGLWLAGNTTGKVTNSLFHTNALNGLQMTENAQPRLEQNRLYDNTQSGIVYVGSAGGSAVNNESYGNGHHGIGLKGDSQPRLENNEAYDNKYHGIQVAGNAQPRLEQNRLYDNTESGIVYFGSAGGSAVSNESYGNGLSGIGLQGDAQPRLENNEAYGNKSHGIQVTGNAQPRLEQNRLHDNTESGIAYGGSAGGSAVNNESYGNGLNGIGLQGDAQPRLEQNRLHDNTESGIAYGGSAGGSAVSNESFSNGLHGIGLKDNAQPRLEQNRLHDNTKSGIAYAGSAGGSAVSNESYGNGYHGIGLKDNAQPRLEQNRLHDNTQIGIRYADSAGGSAVNNESYGNGLHGIQVTENAQPRLEQNRLYDNTEAGILYADSAGGSASNNISYNNYGGIVLLGSANPTLNNNTTYGNQDGGIVDLR